MLSRSALGPLSAKEIFKVTGNKGHHVGLSAKFTLWGTARTTSSVNSLRFRQDSLEAGYGARYWALRNGAIAELEFLTQGHVGYLQSPPVL